LCADPSVYIELQRFAGVEKERTVSILRTEVVSQREASMSVCRLLGYSAILKMEAVCSSDKVVSALSKLSTTP
jgi:hypothetical protein